MKTKKIQLLVVKKEYNEIDVLQVKKILGEGSFGRVLEVKSKTDIAQKKRFAFKSSVNQQEQDIKNEIELLHELHSKATANGKTIVGIQDPPKSVKNLTYFDSNSFGVGFMGTLYDGDFEALAKDLKPDELKSVINQLVEGAKCLNDNSIAHLDMNPRNILLRHEGGKIVAVHADFGGAGKVTDNDNTRVSTTLATTLKYINGIVRIGERSSELVYSRQLPNIHGALLARSIIWALSESNEPDDGDSIAVTLRGKGLSEEAINLLMAGVNGNTHGNNSGEKFLYGIQSLIS